MKVVYKYTRDLLQIQHVFYLPPGAKILTTGLNPANHKEFALWALISDNLDATEVRRVWMLATGFDKVMNTVKLEYINSFQPDHTMIFHSFEVK